MRTQHLLCQELMMSEMLDLIRGSGLQSLQIQSILFKKVIGQVWVLLVMQDQRKMDHINSGGAVGGVAEDEGGGVVFVAVASLQMLLEVGW